MGVTLYNGSSVTLPSAPSLQCYVYHPSASEWLDGIVDWWRARELSGDWYWMPWLRPKVITSCCGTNVSRGIFEFKYGNIARPELFSHADYDPTLLGGCYVAVWAHWDYGSVPLWCGIIETETIAPHGRSDFPQGVQTWEALGIEFLWERVEPNGVWTEDGFIERNVTYNRRNPSGLGWLGNRSSEVGEAGVYVFSGDSEAAAWTNYQILATELQYWSPFQVTITGQVDALSNIVTEHNFNHLNLFQRVNELISRHRGLTWRLIPMTDGSLLLDVISLLADPAGYGDTFLAGNPDQCIIDFNEDPWVKPTVTFNKTATFGSVRIEGAPIATCFSLSIGDGTLEPAWTEELEAEYEAGVEGGDSNKNDMARRDPYFKGVYEKFAPPSDWDFSAGDGIGGEVYTCVIPTCLPDGTIDWTTASAFWRKGGTSFRPMLPIYDTVDTEMRSPRSPFCLVKDTDDDYHFVNQLISMGQVGGHVQFAENELAVFVISNDAAHRWALNHWAEDHGATNVSPVYDFSNFIFTVFLESEQKLYVQAGIPGVDALHANRVKIIKDESAVYWNILPGTVTEVREGALVHSEGVVVRDDSERLRKMLAFAIAYYTQQRNTLDLLVERIVVDPWPGALVRNAITASTILPIGTVVTSVTWDFDMMTTHIQTGFEELDLRLA